MSNEIVPQVFESQEFGAIRAMRDANGEPWFVASDIAKALGYRMASDMTRRLDDDEKGTRSVRTPSGEQQMTVITEAGMYSAILGSKVEGAKRFKRWVTHEVLPALRRDGAYVASDGAEDDATLMARALLAAKRAIDRKDRRIAELEPKALFADAVSASDGTCLVGELAKMMTQAGFTVGQNRLFAILRNDGYLGKSGSNRNVPLQRYVEQGLFSVKETAITHSDGHVTISRTTKVTGKGQRYFIERYCMAIA
ncbi:phage antirepressor KilAC domain-containing protein [Parafannyhessea umbonata]|uniref:phage antirepressor n=1 Tax=Parafannyhessea umbonata TaxID=604330 RepID=UPI002A8151CE|nr:phage antirepressor KilAC domain-containing protein [Parafannyhessea umbonata]MDY4014382.1 phage antirepressor KilAC domain-containing protein [Parafannyhessea umbonata]